MLFEKCKVILLQEIELIRRIAGLQEQIKEAVVSRNWTDFENYFNVLGEIGGEFAALEGKREELFNQENQIPDFDSSDSKRRFYYFAARFPDMQRNELTSLYRTLKLETLRVQTAGEAFMGFIIGARAAFASFIEVAFPDRGGRIYSPYGKPIAHDMRSMVLNRNF